MAAGVAPLPVEVLASILSHVEYVSDVLNARNATDLLRQPAADLIATLLAEDGVLPDEAWEVYRNATALHVPCPGHVEGSDGSTKAEKEYISTIINRIKSLLASLPSRVTWLHIAELELDRHYEEFSTLLATAITSSSSSSTLLDLALDTDTITLTTEAADKLLAGLPALRSVQLRVCACCTDDSNQQAHHIPGGVSYEDAFVLPWRPALPPGLTQLVLKGADWPPLLLDTTSLASAKQLRSLYLSSRVSALNCSSIAQLTNLHYIGLSRTDLLASQYWQVISHLPSLSAFETRAILQLSSRQVLTSQRQQITRLTAARLELDLPGSQLTGSLTAALPNLKQLQAGCSSLHQVATALHKHTALRNLELWCGEAGAQEHWARQQLSTLTALTSLELTHTPKARPTAANAAYIAAAVADAARCTALQQLSITAGHGLGDQQLLALAAAPISSSLTSLQLSAAQGTATLAAVAAVLSTGLSKLQRLRLSSGEAHQDVLRDQKALQDPPPDDTDLLGMLRRFADSTELVKAAMAAAQSVRGVSLWSPVQHKLPYSYEREARRVLKARLEMAGRWQLLPAEAAAALLEEVDEGVLLRQQLAWLLTRASSALVGEFSDCVQVVYGRCKITFEEPCRCMSLQDYVMSRCGLL